MRSILALAALGAAAFCFVAGESLPVSLLPLLSSGLGVSLSVAGFLVTIYAVTVVLASAPLTQLTRRISRRALLVALLSVFVLGTLGAAAAPAYGWLVAARVLTALAQAVFWSIAAVVAAGMFPSAARGRALAGMYAGSTVALVAAVPAGNWLGEVAGWRLPFVVLSGAGLLVLGALLLLLPRRDEGGGSLAAPGTQPDGRRYAAILATTLLCVAGFFTANTYVTAFLIHVAGVPSGRVALVLLVAGVADAAGLATFGHLVDRRARLTGPVATGLVAVSLAALLPLSGCSPRPSGSGRDTGARSPPRRRSARPGSATRPPRTGDRRQEDAGAGRWARHTAAEAFQGCRASSARLTKIAAKPSSYTSLHAGSTESAAASTDCGRSIT